MQVIGLPPSATSANDNATAADEYLTTAPGNAATLATTLSVLRLAKCAADASAEKLRRLQRLIESA